MKKRYFGLVLTFVVMGILWGLQATAQAYTTHNVSSADATLARPLAQGGLYVRNSTGGNVLIAIANYDYNYNDFWNQGWFSLRPGEVVELYPWPNGFVYLYAQDANGRPLTKMNGYINVYPQGQFNYWDSQAWSGSQPQEMQRLPSSGTFDIGTGSSFPGGQGNPPPNQNPNIYLTQCDKGGGRYEYRWFVEGVREIYFNGEGVTGPSGERWAGGGASFRIIFRDGHEEMGNWIFTCN